MTPEYPDLNALIENLEKVKDGKILTSNIYLAQALMVLSLEIKSLKVELQNVKTISNMSDFEKTLNQIGMSWENGSK